MTIFLTLEANGNRELGLIQINILSVFYFIMFTFQSPALSPPVLRPMLDIEKKPPIMDG